MSSRRHPARGKEFLHRTRASGNPWFILGLISGGTGTLRLTLLAIPMWRSSVGPMVPRSGSTIACSSQSSEHNFPAASKPALPMEYRPLAGGPTVPLADGIRVAVGGADVL